MQFRFNPILTLSSKFSKGRITPSSDRDTQQLNNDPESKSPRFLLPETGTGLTFGEDGLNIVKVKIPASHPSLQLSRTLGKMGKSIGRASRVAVSPDNSRIAIGSYDGRVLLLDPDPINSSRSISLPFQGSKDQGVSALEFSADSSKLLVVWKEGIVIVFDAKDGAILNECVMPYGMDDCSISKDGRQAVIGGNSWKMFDFDSFPSKSEEEVFDSQEKRVSCLDFSDDKLIVGVGVNDGDDNGCHVYNSKGTKLLYTFCKGLKVYTAVMSNNNMILAVGCEEGKVYLFNVTTGDCLHTLQIKTQCRSIKFSKDGKRIFFGTYGGIFGYDVYSGKEDFQCPVSAENIALWEDNTILAACDFANMQVINADLKPTHQMEHEEEVHDSAVSPDGELMAFTYRDHERGVEIFDTSNNRLKWKGSGDIICFSPCGKKVACGSTFSEHSSKYCWISICNAEDGTNLKTIHLNPNYRNCVIQFLDSKNILIFQKGGFGGKTAQVISIETVEKKFSITTSTNIFGSCIIPRKNLFAIITEELISFHNTSNGILHDSLTYSLSEKHDVKLQAMKCTSDGSKILLFFGSFLDVYKFDSKKGIYSSSRLSFPFPLLDDKDIIIKHIAVSKDGKVVAFSDGRHIYTCSLNKGDKERKVHKSSMNVSIGSLNFLPRSSSTSRYHLVVSYYNYTSTFEVDAKRGLQDPSLLLRCFFANSDDRNINALIPKHMDLLHQRDESGLTLAELAIKHKRPAVLLRILDLVKPTFSWASPKVLEYLIHTSDANRIEVITIGNKCVFAHIDPNTLERLVKMIPSLAENGSIEIICYLLQAGSSMCASGCVPGRKMYLKSFLNYHHLFRLLNYFALNANTPCDGSQIIPETSSCPSDIEMFDEYEKDEQKRILLNAVRALLPYLSSFDVLSALVDINPSLGEDSKSSNVIPSHLMPFRCESLQASIEAAWYSWAGPLFIRRALVYILWMVCIITLDYASTIGSKVALLVPIFIGWLYFVNIEKTQRLRYQKGSVIFYYYNFWNLWQILTLALVFLYVTFNIVDMSNLSGISILSGQKWFAGLVNLFTLINFLDFCRGIERVSWILYALKVLTIKMYSFLAVLLWILLSASTQLTRLDDALDSKRPIHVFADTYVTAVFGAIESSEYGIEYIEASELALFLFIILSLIFIIFMNAMIAFISEEFANILDYKAAILAREKASIIVDMYCTMSDEERKRIEDQCKWVYKLFKQTDLNKMDSDSIVDDADGRRATKQDIQSNTLQLVKLKKENRDMKSSLERIEKENGEMKKESNEVKSCLKRIEKDNSELKVTLEKLVSMLGK